MDPITLKYTTDCHDCGTTLGVGASVRWYGRGRIYGTDCHDSTDHGAPSVRRPLAYALDAASKGSELAYDAYTAQHYKAPAYAVVENAAGDWASDPNKPERVVDIMSDVCGFATVHVDNSRRNGAPGAQFISAFKASGKAHAHLPEWSITTATATYRLHRSSYTGRAALGSPWTVRGGYHGYGNGAMGAAGASAEEFCKVLAAHGYVGLSVTTRID